MKHMHTGRLGEAVAGTYLESLGYTILHTNVRIAGVEIDIIAEKDKVYYFVEVKSSGSNVEKARPIDRVTEEKQTRLVRAADWYSREYKREVSILLISVWINPSTKTAVCEMLIL